MSYVLLNKNSRKPLSYFYSGDIASRKAIMGNRPNSYLVFATAIQAREKIQYMRDEVYRREFDYGPKVTRACYVYINNLEIQSI